MPVDVKRAYKNALRHLSRDSRSRLDMILDADPRMAKYINEHGLVAAAQSPYPVAVIPPDDYLRMARKTSPDESEGQNYDNLLGRVGRRPPGMTWRPDLDWDAVEEPAPRFMDGYLKHNPGATAKSIYQDKGIGLPSGEDYHHGLGVSSHLDGEELDFGGLPVLKYTPRGERMISITDHEGRGRNAFAKWYGFSLPVHMAERTAIQPNDSYLPTRDLGPFLRRLGRPSDDMTLDDVNSALNHGEGYSLNNNEYPMSRDEAKGFLQQIKGVIPEDYVRYGINRRGEMDGTPLAVPWKHKVFAEGGSVDGDDTGFLRTIGNALRTMPHNTISPLGTVISKGIPRVAEGIASEYYGVNQEGKVNFGGYTPGAPLRDRFRPNVAVEPMALSAVWGSPTGLEALDDVSRTDDAVREAFGLGDEKGFLDSAAYMTGKAAAVPILSAGRGLQTITESLLRNAPKYLKYPIKAAEMAVDVFNPMSGRVRDTPAAGLIGAGIGEGVNAYMEHAIGKQEASDAAEFNDIWRTIQQAAASGDPEAQQFLASAEAQRLRASFGE